RLAADDERALRFGAIHFRAQLLERALAGMKAQGKRAVAKGTDGFHGRLLGGNRTRRSYGIAAAQAKDVARRQASPPGHGVRAAAARSFVRADASCMRNAK